MTIYVSEILARARSRTDKNASTFISDSTDGIPWVDEAHRELYELLVVTYGDEYFMQRGAVTALADTASSSIAQILIAGGGEEIVYRNPWKLVRVECAFDGISIPMGQFSFADTVLDSSSHAWDTGVDIRYRWADQKLWWAPTPSANQNLIVYFVPVVQELLGLSDTIEPACEPWYEYLVACVALKMAQKERDTDAVQSFAAEKLDIRQRVLVSAPARDIGQPQTIVDVRGVAEGDLFRDGWR